MLFFSRVEAGVSFLSDYSEEATNDNRNQLYSEHFSKFTHTNRQTYTHTMYMQYFVIYI